MYNRIFNTLTTNECLGAQNIRFKVLPFLPDFLVPKRWPFIHRFPFQGNFEGAGRFTQTCPAGLARKDGSVGGAVGALKQWRVQSGNSCGIYDIFGTKYYPVIFRACFISHEIRIPSWTQYNGIPKTAGNTKYDRAVAKCSCKVRSSNQSRLILCEIWSVFNENRTIQFGTMGNKDSLIGQQWFDEKVGMVENKRKYLIHEGCRWDLP